MVNHAFPENMNSEKIIRKNPYWKKYWGEKSTYFSKNILRNGKI